MGTPWICFWAASWRVRLPGPAAQTNYCPALAPISHRELNRQTLRRFVPELGPVSGAVRFLELPQKRIPFRADLHMAALAVHIEPLLNCFLLHRVG